MALTQKQKELIMKIKALADNGVAGEKVNARKKLEDLMDRFGITERDLEVEIKKDYRFIIQKDNYYYLKKLLFQLSPRHTTYYTIASSVYIKLTASEFIELKAKYDFYANRFIHDLDVFYLAFLGKNDLFVPVEPGEKLELTPDEEEKRLKASLMSRGLDRHLYHKQLECK